MRAKLQLEARHDAACARRDLHLGPSVTQVVAAPVGLDAAPRHAEPVATPRRTFLSAIAGAPALALLSGRTDAKPDAAAGLDAAVVAKAAEVWALIVESHAAYLRWEDLQDAMVRALGPKPRIDRDAIADLCCNVLFAFGALTPRVDAAVAAKRQALEDQLSAEIAAWEAAEREMADRLGVKLADAGADRMWDTMDAAMAELAAMPVASLAGIVAKASIFRAPYPFSADDFSHQDFAAAVLRDLGAAVEATGGDDV